MMNKIKLPHSLSGRVVRGNRIGRQLGFPTANLALTGDGVTDGVYAVRVAAGGTTYGGVANAGSRPTVTESRERFLEVYLFGFEGDLYGKTIAVEFVAFLRPQQKFDSVEALRRQIERDIQAAKLCFKHDC